MATFDRNLGTWTASDGSGGFATRQLAEEYENSGQRTYEPVYDSIGNDFGTGPLTGAQAAGVPQVAQRPVSADGFTYEDEQGGYTPAYYEAQNALDASSNVAASGRIGTWGRDDYVDSQTLYDRAIALGGKDRHGDNGGVLGDLGRLGAYVGGAVMNPVGFLAGDYIGEPAQAVVNPIGYGAQKVLEQGAGFIPGGSGTGVVNGSYQADGGGGAVAPGSSSIRTPPRTDGAAGAPGGGTVPTDAQGNVDQDQQQRDEDKKTLTELWEETRYNGSPEAEESRRQQQQALAKQVELYDILAKFDPDAYAEKSADVAMKNQLALARSTPGGAAAGAEGIFQALEQGPAISAEAARGADAALLDRQRLAAQVTGQMGDLASTTRSQDVGEAQLESQFGQQIAEGISSITGLDWQLDSKESASLAQLALALDSQNIDWAKLDLDSQIAEANRVLAEAGLTQQWRIFQAGQGLSERDLYGGLLSVLGTGLGGFMQIEAAKAGR